MKRAELWGARARRLQHKNSEHSILKTIKKHKVLSGGVALFLLASAVNITDFGASGPSDPLPASPGISSSSMGIGENGLSAGNAQVATFANQYEIVWPSNFNLSHKDKTHEWVGGYKYMGLPVTVYDNPVSHRGEFKYKGKICIVNFRSA